jgi:hypothetical protein
MKKLVKLVAQILRGRVLSDALLLVVSGETLILGIAISTYADNRVFFMPSK